MLKQMNRSLSGKRKAWLPTGSKLSVASQRQAHAVDADVVVQVVTLGAVHHLVIPLVVEGSRFRLAGELALVLAVVREPLNVRVRHRRKGCSTL